MTPELASICSKLDIEAIPPDSYRRPMETYAVQTMENILSRFGEGHLTLVLRSIVETSDNDTELVAPTILAMHDVIRAHPEWPGMGLRWLDAVDGVNLRELRDLAKENRGAVRLRGGIATLLYMSLRMHFGVNESKGSRA